ncbi:MAG TPA: choice-of-anchor J domain-containing protein [Bacteroidales bacterium]|nr:choice-of-anchor J domain-containing protein [Bacteroidales bacterium]
MKYLKYITLAFIVIFTACDLTNPLEDDLDAIDNKLNKQLEYTLADDDYATLANLAHNIYPEDSNNIAFFQNRQYFTDEVSAAKYVPLFMNSKFPNLGAGTYADVSYNYSGEVPEDLKTYSEAPVYSLSSTDLKEIGDDTGAAGYLYPVYSPEKVLPEILKERLDTASSGAIYQVSYKYSDVSPKIDYSAYAINPVWANDFSDETTFQRVNKAGGQEWSFIATDEGSASIEGWDGSKNNPNEDWLISPEIDLSEVTTTYLQMQHGVEYFAPNSLYVLVSENYDGENVDNANWEEIPFPNYEGSSKNNYIETEVIDITDFDGEKVHIAFKYVSTNSSAPYWAIGNVKVGPYGYKVTGKTPYLVNDFYEFNGDDWNKLDNVHYINKSNFEKIGFSKGTSSFTAEQPASDYLSDYAAVKYPMSNNSGNQIVFVYDYDNGSDILTLADQLTYKDGIWQSSYDYVRPITEPYAATENGWVFDPTINFTMTSEDYELIAVYVKNDPVLSELEDNTYDDSEYYYGASAYYANFDTRGGNFYEGFDSWEEAVTEAIGEVLLPAKYPEAQTQYKGIDMHYIVHFTAYGAPSSNYFIKFQCTKSAPNPEFTLVEGPVAE